MLSPTARTYTHNHICVSYPTPGTAFSVSIHTFVSHGSKVQSSSSGPNPICGRAAIGDQPSSKGSLVPRGWFDQISFLRCQLAQEGNRPRKSLDIGLFGVARKVHRRPYPRIGASGVIHEFTGCRLHADVYRVEAAKRLLSLGRGSPVSGGSATVLSTRLHS